MDKEYILSTHCNLIFLNYTLNSNVIAIPKGFFAFIKGNWKLCMFIVFEHSYYLKKITPKWVENNFHLETSNIFF